MCNKIIHIQNIELRDIYTINENAIVTNTRTGNIIKPYKDKRRPNEPPYIFLKRSNGSRISIYLDELMARTFIESYNKNDYIHHIDGDIENCSLDNLEVLNPFEYLKNIENDDKEWRKVNIPNVDLYYTYYISEDGRLFNAATYSFVKPFINIQSNGSKYKRFNLYRSKSIDDVIHYSVNRLVAEHFIPYHHPDKMYVYPLDGNYDNSDYRNLAWGDRFDVIYNYRMINSVNKDTLKINGLKKEKWKSLNLDILENNRYDVSSYGRVYDNHYKSFVFQDTNMRNPNNQGYKRVKLKLKNGSWKWFLVHRLVAFLFVPNKSPEENLYVNHINGNPEFNVYINLEWVNAYNNINHSIKTNLTHTAIYTNNIKNIETRTESVVAWVITICRNNIKSAFILLSDYIKYYEPNLISFKSENDFLEWINIHKKESKDFNVLLTSYSEWISDINNIV